MAWLTTNWFWILIIAAFIGMHVFGHGHGGHGGKARRGQDGDKDGAQSRAEKGRPGGHPP